MNVRTFRVTRKTLLIAVATSVALFVIAAPFGGNGKNHHTASYEFGNVIFTLFLISVLVFILMVIVAVVQAVVARGRTSR